jgi:hypothetical protein
MVIGRHRQLSGLFESSITEAGRMNKIDTTKKDNEVREMELEV